MATSPLTTVLLLAGVALVTWGTVRLATRRHHHAPDPPPSHARVATNRPQRRLDRHPARPRGPRDVRCPAGRTLAPRHPARRPADG